MTYPIAQPVVYEFDYALKLEMAQKIEVNIDQLQLNVLAACHNEALPRALQHQIYYLLSHVLPRDTNEESKALEVTKITQSNIDLILWLLINYNDLIWGHERILLQTQKNEGRKRVGYGIVVPAACHPDSVSLLSRGVLLHFGWMDKVPSSSIGQPKTTTKIPADGHGGKFYQFGWIDESYALEDNTALTPPASYLGPILEWSTLSPELQKSLEVLSEDQDEFLGAWNDASKKIDQKTITQFKRRHAELSPWRMADSLYDRLLAPRPTEREQEGHYGLQESYDDSDEETDDSSIPPKSPAGGFSLSQISLLLTGKHGTGGEKQSASGGAEDNGNEPAAGEGVVASGGK